MEEANPAKAEKKTKAKVKAKPEKEHCVICDEEFNKSNRNKVECSFCNHVACRVCCTEFLLGCEEPMCMFPDCKRPWTRKFCTDAFTQAFMKKTYRELRETRLFHHEQSLLPATQIIVEEYNRISKLLLQSIAMQEGYAARFYVKRDAIEAEITISKLAYRKRIYDPENMTEEEIINAAVVRRPQNDDTLDPSFSEKREIQRSILEDLKYRLESVSTRIYVYEKNIGIFRTRINNLVRHLSHGFTEFLNPYRRLTLHDDEEGEEGEREGEEEQEHEKKPEVKKRVFVRACPNNDCRGFLSSQWKCGLCEHYTCSKCHVLKEKDDTESNKNPHVCNPDNVASAALLKKDCKPCPKCAASIFKIDGCDQMWCTVCSTAFSWKSGTLITNGIIHNPHYFEWMRRQDNGEGGQTADRNHMEIRCGRELNYRFAQRMRIKLKIHDAPNQLIVTLDNIIGSVNHVRYIAQDMQPNAVENNLMLRFRYLTNDISLAHFKKLVQMANKRFEHKREMRDILVTFVQTATDIVYDYYDSLDSDKLAELDRFLEYINTECFPELKSVYNTSSLFFIQFRNEGGPVIAAGNEVLINLNAKKKNENKIEA